MTMIDYAYYQHRRLAKASAPPSSSPSLDYHINDARTPEDGSAPNRRVNESTKVLLRNY